MLGFVKVLGYFASLECVDRTKRYQYHVIEQRQYDSDVGTLAAQYDRPPVGIHEGRIRKIHADPRDGGDDLDGDQARADHQLRLRTRVARPLHHGLDAAVEDPGDPVRLREERRVAHRQRQAESDARQAARGHRRLGHHDERHHVAEQEADHQDVAELAAGSHDDGRVVELDEYRRDEDRRQDPDRGDDDRNDRPDAVERHVVDRKRLAARLRRVRIGAVRARLARVFVLQDHVTSAPDAHPAALVQRVVVPLHVTRWTRLAAHRLRYGHVSWLPFRQRQVDG